MKANVPVETSWTTYLTVEMTPEQELRVTMNVADREFTRREITGKQWHKRQRKAIKKYRKSIVNNKTLNNKT